MKLPVIDYFLFLMLYERASASLNGPNVCTKQLRTAYAVNYRQATRQVYKMITVCCKGWKQVGDKCPQAICSQKCEKGTCDKPDFCKCNPGYYGKLCDRGHVWQ
ncbi:epidermal growth factor-like protein 8 [Exaiptasia diaphana]|uniref:EMI domain-containing protein n=1 Tax=Exaiptasia diaphana TaxID=2652724 RepID=A0A913Y049_EXADI|nr:epidermal growth factor-like protein 8 [Exaiptasia diaphana]